MPTAEYLDGISETRRLARSLVHEALRVSSVAMQPEQQSPLTKWTRQKIYDAVCHFVTTYGRCPRWDEWRIASQYGLPSRVTVRRQWGSCATLHDAVRTGMRGQMYGPGGIDTQQTQEQSCTANAENRSGS